MLLVEGFQKFVGIPFGISRIFESLMPQQISANRRKNHSIQVKKEKGNESGLLLFMPFCIESTRLPSEFHRDPAYQIISTTARFHGYLGDKRKET